jgi:uncharacterized protein (TIGR02600 family)
VIVLAILVLVTVATMGFFARTQSMRRSSANEKAATSTNILADTVVNLIQAQIDHATTRKGMRVWSSQPGAIRLFKSDGELETVYRLFSSTAMVTSNAADLDNDLPPLDWAQKPAEWVDLNSPVGVLLDSGTPASRFPILDPRDPDDLANLQSTEGFRLVNPPGATSDQPAPMPVRWLYVLQDGRIVSPIPVSGRSASVPGATESNPIAGRIAFWTDDETCRLNVNTSGGSASGSASVFWDTPRFDAVDERDFGIFQPATGEFQRYPGHPATTSLAKVFPSLSSEQLLSLAPRFNYGGSRDGTVIPASRVPPKTERKLPTIGEMAFQESRDRSILSDQEIESARFFLTAHSRAPEINLFGTPRVSVWPVSTESAKRTATDHVLAFASTINSQPYGFTRTNSKSLTQDVESPRNAVLLDYLDELTSRPIPGFGGSFSSKYPDDRRDILVKTFDYIRCTNLADPTLPEAQRYASDGMVVPAVKSDWGSTGFGRHPVISEVSLWIIALGRGASTAPPSSAIPIHSRQIGTKSDAGNAAFWSPSDELVPANDRTAIQAFLVVSLFDPAQGWSVIKAKGPTIRVSGLDKLSLDVAGQNYPMNMPPSAAKFMIFNPINIFGGAGWGGVRNFRDFFATFNTSAGTAHNCAPLGPNDANGVGGRYPFFSNILSVPSTGTMRLVAPEPIRIEVFAGGEGNTSSANLTSTYAINLSELAGNAMPVPKVAANKTNAFGLPNNVSATEKRTSRDRAYLALFFSQNFDDKEQTVHPDDVLWSLVASGTGVVGDYRMLAKSSISTSAFRKHSNVADGVNLAYTSPWALSFFRGATPGGKLVENAAYPVPSPLTAGANHGSTPPIPSGINGVTVADNGTTPGDWDNGFSVVPDGPYINKADEGNTQGIGTTTSPYFDGSFFSNDTSLIASSLFSPNRMVPSAGMLGSIPTGVQSGKPWQTLLFRPAPTGHPAAQGPQDHLFLDLFWMPVAEPYAISEPFSTDGKVNMNYEIQPFTYIRRNTALRSVLDSERIAKVGQADSARYKRRGVGLGREARLGINLDESDGSLRRFEERFANRDVFKSPTEICDVFLVPAGESWSSDSQARTEWYGEGFAMVGDNTRERPYANLLGKLTTKSNTFTIHYIVQSLAVPAALTQDQWDESRGRILGEMRGSAAIERYIDPNDPDIPDYAADPAKIVDDPLDSHYNWRVISNRQFAP